MKIIVLKTGIVQGGKPVPVGATIEASGVWLQSYLRFGQAKLAAEGEKPAPTEKPDAARYAAYLNAENVALHNRITAIQEITCDEQAAHAQTKASLAELEKELASEEAAHAKTKARLATRDGEVAEAIRRLKEREATIAALEAEAAKAPASPPKGKAAK
jgi:hypothetical protein